MKTYNCSISEKGRENFVSVFQVKANNLKEAKKLAGMQKTNYHQKVDVKLSK